MKHLTVLVLSVFCTVASGQVREMSLAQLEQRVTSDTLYIVNFWATWCGPCVAELPHFEKINQEYSSKKVKVILLSIDFEQYRSKLEKFVVSKALKSEVRLFNEKNPNNWINAVDTEWGGSIPATVLYKKGKKIAFHEGDFSYQGLKSFIKLHIP